MTITNTTLHAGLKDPRFAIIKDGWDYTPRELLPADVIARPIWTIGFDKDAYGMDDNPIALVTNFPGEGPAATVEHEGCKRTIYAATLDLLADAVVVAFYELEKEHRDAVAACIPSLIEEEVEEEVEVEEGDVLFQEMNDEQHEIFEAAWIVARVRDLEIECGMSAKAAKRQAPYDYENYINQEGYTGRDLLIGERRT